MICWYSAPSVNLEFALDRNNPKLTSLCEKSLGSAIGRRNRLPHHCKPSSYRTVGQAVSPVERLFTQTLTVGVRYRVYTEPRPSGRGGDERKRSGDSLFLIAYRGILREL